uniref:G_PROTEIN_RECEP_F3_4 domain-containing protein n=1 Tax=Mesocestoides corti TaxID=53468 RepID=A0A5K3EI57_MESCO
MRGLSTVLLVISIAAIVAALAISDWRNGLAFGGSSHDKEAMTAVTLLIVVGLACFILVFILDVVVLCQSVVPSGLLTARFLILYLGVALVMTGVLVFTARQGRQWPYFLCIVGAVFSVLVAILAAFTSSPALNHKGVTRVPMTNQHPYGAWMVLAELPVSGGGTTGRIASLGVVSRHGRHHIALQRPSEVRSNAFRGLVQEPGGKGGFDRKKVFRCNRICVATTARFP